MKIKFGKKRKIFLGMTLVEVLVSISIFTICMAGFSYLFSRSWKNNAYILEMGQASASASRGMNKLVEIIRKAKQGENGNYTIVSARENQFTFYVDYDGDGLAERAHIYLENQEVKIGITEPQGGAVKSYPSEDQQVEILVKNVLNSSGENLFNYYNRYYPADLVNNPIDLGSNDISNIRMTEINLRINTDNNRLENDLRLRSFVEIRNLNDYDRIK